ncbi:MAG: pro-sigmaK processing inhibitor BofA family protein [Methanocaldococcus sp.]
MSLEHLILLILIVLVGVLFFKLTFKILRYLAINTIVGLILVGILNFLGITHIHLNLINLLIIAIGGVIGVFILIIMSLL